LFTSANELVTKLRDENVVLKCIVTCFILCSIFVSYKYIRHCLKKRDMALLGSVLKSVRDGTNNRTWKYDVFLSYNSRDREWVKNLYEFLTAKEYKVCFDEENFPYGCCIPKEIANAVSRSRKVVAIVSPNFISSGWTEFEYVFSITQIVENKESWDSLLPVLYKQCEMPEILKIFKYIDYAALQENVPRQSFLGKSFTFFQRRNCAASAKEEVNEKFKNILIRRLGKPLGLQNKKNIKDKRNRRKKKYRAY